METLLNNPYLSAIAALTAGNLILVMVLFWLGRKYQKRQAALLKGEGESNLLEIVLKQKKLLASHNKNLRELGKILEELIENNRNNIQHIGIIRFNPFPETGGNISFSLALLDAHKNGILISSLHSREGTRIYAKPVEKGESKYPLTDEEKKVIVQALK